MVCSVAKEIEQNKNVLNFLDTGAIVLLVDLLVTGPNLIIFGLLLLLLLLLFCLHSLAGKLIRFSLYFANPKIFTRKYKLWLRLF